jgi:hypothetical protein
MAFRHLRVSSECLMVTAEREGPADSITCVRQEQLGQPGEVDLQKLCSPCARAIPLGHFDDSVPKATLPYGCSMLLAVRVGP